MSRANENPVCDSLIDRLVDGELDDNERQRLLARLELEPGGWRRCALAFLEAQEWTRTFSSASGEILALHSSDDPGETAIIPWRRRGPATQRSRWVGVLAVSVTLAFASGWLAGATTRPADSATAPIPKLAASEAPKLANAVKTMARERRKASDETDPEHPRRPVVPTPENSSWDAGPPLVLSNPVRKELERRGYRVEQRTGLMSMELEDGQSLAVPVDEVELRYVGNPIY